MPAGYVPVQWIAPSGAAANDEPPVPVLAPSAALAVSPFAGAGEGGDGAGPGVSPSAGAAGEGHVEGAPPSPAAAPDDEADFGDVEEEA